MTGIGEEFLWIVIVGGIASFITAFAIGANDVANTFSAAVGGRALPLWVAIILASILETLGATLLGATVTENIKSNVLDFDYFKSNPPLLALGMLCALLGAGAWLLCASKLGLPVSTTHSVIGALIGVGLGTGDMNTIRWSSIVIIIISWFIAPLSACIVGSTLFFFIRTFVLRATHPLKRAYWVFPFFIFLVSCSFSFFLVYKNPFKSNTVCYMYNTKKKLYETSSPCLWGAWASGHPGHATAISFGIASVLTMLLCYIIVSLARRRINFYRDKISFHQRDSLSGRSVNYQCYEDAKNGVEGIDKVIEELPLKVSYVDNVNHAHSMSHECIQDCSNDSCIDGKRKSVYETRMYKPTIDRNNNKNDNNNNGCIGNSENEKKEINNKYKYENKNPNKNEEMINIKKKTITNHDKKMADICKDEKLYRNSIAKKKSSIKKRYSIPPVPKSDFVPLKTSNNSSLFHHNENKNDNDIIIENTSIDRLHTVGAPRQSRNSVPFDLIDITEKKNTIYIQSPSTDADDNENHENNKDNNYIDNKRNSIKNDNIQDVYNDVVIPLYFTGQALHSAENQSENNNNNNNNNDNNNNNTKIGQETGTTHVYSNNTENFNSDSNSNNNDEQNYNEKKNKKNEKDEKDENNNNGESYNHQENAPYEEAPSLPLTLSSLQSFVTGNTPNNNNNNNNFDSDFDPIGNTSTWANRLKSTAHSKWSKMPWFKDIHTDACDDDLKIGNLHSSAEKFHEETEILFSCCEIISSCLGCLAHSANDTANAIGPFAAILSIYYEGVNASVKVEWYILMAGGLSMSLGLALLGHRVMQTMGVKLVKITPARGFAIELGAAWTVLLFSVFAIPLSTTHCAVGSTLGVGLLEPQKQGTTRHRYCFPPLEYLNISTVNWTLFTSVFVSWIGTVFFSAAVSMTLFAFAAYSPTRLQ